MAAQFMAGNLITGWIRGVENPLLSAPDHKTPATLPEPVRWYGINGALGLANVLHDRANDKARAAQALRA
ncbi:hypothetical protein [Paraburkholderia pallida]|uniref:Uncharacterized protein n=1 Tax=Paraburkholderia pallida TaxID=2547399 RepID=A0A4P7D542_9BURK|nr:hypothetical protein [Paraburkholderia pallida]QBR03941.1 hypothetical protein E1956_42795 [Paraburkholderia pallida]